MGVDPPDQPGGRGFRVLQPIESWAAPRAHDPVNAIVRLPGSKSITARALILGAASVGASTLRRPLAARDTGLMAAGLRALGVHVSTVDPDLWVVRPGPMRGPAEIDVGVAGTVMRFLPPLAALADGPVSFDGDRRARRRPMGPLIEALRRIGVDIDTPRAGSLPFTVRAKGEVRGGEVTMDASSSSQLISGLLLAAPDFDQGLVVRHEGAPLPRAPHIRMTVSMLRAVGAGVDDSTPDVWAVAPGRIAGRGWTIEPDLSNAAPFFAAALVTGGRVAISGWPAQTAQPGNALELLFAAMGARLSQSASALTVRGEGRIRGIDADLSAVSELVPVIAALCALADSPSTLHGLGHLRSHESDWLSALAQQLENLGAGVAETRHALMITPRPLRGGVFATYQDHRLATAAAVLGLVVDGVVVSDVGCTAKTLPGFTTLWRQMLDGDLAPGRSS
ncbi:MAG: 3-phosphoshikimate 1-carboxyvinyltransferase [Micromonosporaceae bacterium]